MGFNVSKNKKRPPEINVTPFVDVLLVLLIVFMVASPALVSGIAIELPNGKAPSTPDVEKKNITVSVNNKNEIFFNDSKCEKNQLLQKFKAIEDSNNTVIFVRGDRNIVYSEVMDIINIAEIAGFKNIVLVTEDADI